MGCWQGRDILTLMVRMMKVAVEEKRLPVDSLLNSGDCPILKEVNKGKAREVVLFKLDEMPLLVGAFAKNIKDAGETLFKLRQIIMA